MSDTYAHFSTIAHNRQVEFVTVFAAFSVALVLFLAGIATARAGSEAQRTGQAESHVESSVLPCLDAGSTAKTPVKGWPQSMCAGAASA
ncbi:hypothetical protein ACFV5G_24290 [Streptomyces sp. NPDC059766]|uniref:hypothetical protein n=1 Tax=Streptomyces sp. NPDC059766 TaxID=3346940 RepID=UPI00366293CA